MSARLRGSAFVLLAAIPLACQEGEFVAYPEIGGECPAARAGSSGQCCPAWTEAEDTRCTLRAWERGTEDDAFGPSGARDPVLSIDGAGRAVLAWEATGDEGHALVVAEETAIGHLGLREPASALAGEAVTPAVAAHEDGRAAVVWRQHDGSESRIYASTRVDTGGWDDPTPSDARSWAGDADDPDVVFGPGSETIVAWSQWTGHDFRVVVSRDRGGEADAPVIVSPPLDFAGGPRLAVADNGDAIVTWTQTGGAGEPMVVASERTRQNGEWTRPGPSDVLSAPGAPTASLPDPDAVPAIDRRGGIAIAWTQASSTGAAPVYLATRDGLGEWTRPESVDDAFSGPGLVARAPRIAIGPSGEVWVAWTEDLGEQMRVVAAVRDAEGTWIEDGRDPAVLSAPGTDASEPALAVGPSGEAVVVFTQKSGEVRRIVARRRHAGGTRWLDPEELSDAAQGDASEPTVAIGPTGRTVAAWVQGPPLAGHVRIAWVD
jgi:hypothetical protein